MIASHRPSCAETAAAVPNAEASSGGDRTDSEAREDASQKESTAVDKSLDCCGKFQLFDIEQEEELEGDSSEAAANPQVSKTVYLKYFDSTVDWYMWAD